MKKFALAILALLLLTFSVSAFASDDSLGVQVIGGPDTAAVPMSLDNIQLGSAYVIDGYAKIIPQTFSFVDYFAQFSDDADYGAKEDWKGDSNRVYYQEKALKGEWAWGFVQASWKDSGANADFAWLQIDIVNLRKKDVKLMEEASVKVIYADEYEYAGWIRQANYDYSTYVCRYGFSSIGAPFAVLSPKNEEAIGMMYTGNFVVGCTLPNAVVEDKASPLQVILTLGGNEIIYNIRQ